MKKVICILLVLIISVCFTGCADSIEYIENEDEVLAYEDIYDKIIRFHVIANSDSKEDQELKLKVRDKVIEYMVPKLSEVESLDEAREILKDSIDEVNKISLNVIKENNYDYSSKTMLSHENFPDKVYGDVVFPAGEYEAFRIVIGNGEGKNWWCVMFPPLCFLDETKDNVDSKDIENKLNEDDEIVFKIKVWDKLKELF